MRPRQQPVGVRLPRPVLGQAFEQPRGGLVGHPLLLVGRGRRHERRCPARTEKFERYAMPRANANVRQILGRPGEVWLPESGTEHITVIRTA